MIRPVTGKPTDAEFGGVGSDAVVAGIGWFVVAGGVALGMRAVRRPRRGQRGGTGDGRTVGWTRRSGPSSQHPARWSFSPCRDRPVLLLPAAIILVPLSFLSFAGVLLPLLIPAGMLFAAYGRRSVYHPLGARRSGLVALSVVALLIAAVISLFVHQDPRQLLDLDRER